MTTLQSLYYQYTLLAFLCFFIFYILGSVISKKSIKNPLSNSEYWKYASLMIIAYIVFMGLRYGRLVDYNIYSNVYDMIEIEQKENFEPVFAFLMFCFKKAGFKYAAFVAFSSLLFVFSFLLYLKNKPEILRLAPLLFLSECFMAENLIKWYFAFSAVLIALYFHNKKKLHSYVFFILACFLHYGMIMVILPFLILLYVPKVLINSKLCCVLFVMVTFMGNINLLGVVEPIIPYLGFNEKLVVYGEQFDELIKGQFGILGIAEKKGLFENIRNIIAFGIPILLAPKMLEKGKITFFELNAFYIGVIIEPIFTQVEVLGRISGCFHFFQLIVCSYVYVYIFKHKIKLSYIQKNASILGLIFLLWPTIRYCLGMGRTGIEDLRFIWDVNKALL